MGETQFGCFIWCRKIAESERCPAVVDTALVRIYSEKYKIYQTMGFFNRRNNGQMSGNFFPDPVLSSTGFTLPSARNWPPMLQLKLFPRPRGWNCLCSSISAGLVPPSSNQSKRWLSAPLWWVAGKSSVLPRSISGAVPVKKSLNHSTIWLFGWWAEGKFGKMLEK